MKKVYAIEVDCANCANKIEQAIRKIPGVADASINFMAGKLTVEWQEDAERKALEKEILKTARKIEPDCQIDF